MVERLVLVPLPPRRPIAEEDLPVVQLVLRAALAGMLEGALQKEGRNGESGEVFQAQGGGTLILLNITLLAK